MPLEIERKFLLKRVPISEDGDENYDIIQFYCSDKTEDFRVRRTVFPDRKEIYYKTVKKFISSGVNEELEGEITKEEFFKYLCTTDVEGKISKIRTVRKYGDLKWEIDKFPFGLVVAEIELPSIDFPLNLPEYITKELIMEVTSFREFGNKNLAEKCFGSWI